MPLSDDQKAMLRLLAQREQGYEDLAALMGLSVDEVRLKVKGALEQLEEEGAEVPSVPEPPVAVEPPAPIEPSRPVEPLTPEPAAEPVAVEPPAAATPAAKQPAAEPAKTSAPAGKRPAASRPKPSLPKGGGARAALAAGVAVLVALVIVLTVSGGDDSGDTTSAGSGESTTASQETNAANSELTQAVLSPVDGGDASGRAIFGKVKKNVVLQVEAKGLDPSPKGSSYTVWLYKSPKLALRVGSVNVPQSGGIAAQFPVPTEVLAYVASGAFDQIDVSLTSTAAYEAEIAKAKKEKRLPAYTGEDVLRGPITGPAIKK